MHIVNFKTSSYFPIMATIFAVIAIPVGILVLFTKVILGLIILAICVIVLTTHYRLEIDFQNKTFHEYTSFLFFFKSGDVGQFETVHYLFIKTKKVSQTVHARVSSATIQKEVFDGYLKFSEEEKVHIDTRDSKEALLKKLKGISNHLKIRIIDYTEGDPKVIYVGK